MSQQTNICQESSNVRPVSPAVIGRQIRDARRSRHMTQAELARAAGCSPSIVHGAEWGYYRATKQWVPRFLALLDLPTPEIEDTPPFEMEAQHIAGTARCLVCGIVLFDQAEDVPDGWIVEWHTAAPDGRTCREHTGRQPAKYGIGG